LGFLVAALLRTLHAMLRTGAFGHLGRGLLRLLLSRRDIARRLRTVRGKTLNGRPDPGYG
jgi:hypothetical protein